MKAVIMAGGKGTRLRPLTCELPKPMVPLLNKPCMEYTVELLRKHGIRDIAVTMQYLPEAIRDYFGTGERFGVRMHYVQEQTPLGTAGSVKHAHEFLDDTFLVISGDALTDFDLEKAFAFHGQKKPLATLVLTRVSQPLEYGVVMTDEQGRVVRFLEKPSWGEVFSDTVNTGIYILEPEVLNRIPAAQPYDFSQDLFPRLLQEQDALYGYVSGGYWSDIGNLQQYRQTQFDMLDGKANVQIKGRRHAPGIFVEEGVEVSPHAHLVGPAFIGEGTKLEDDVIIGEYCIIGKHNRLSKGSSFARSILWDHNHIAEHNEVAGSTLTNRIVCNKASSLGNGSVVGSSVIIGSGSTIHPHVKIWPNKRIRDNTRLHSSFIWGDQAVQTLYKTNGVSGIPNVEVTPEIAARFATAYGAALAPGKLLTVSSSPHEFARLLKRTVTAGLQSVGTDVMDLGDAIAPAAGFAIRTLGAAGGIHIRWTGRESDVCCLECLDAEGLPISKAAERKVENSYWQEDYRRSPASQTGSYKQERHWTESYIRALAREISFERKTADPIRIIVEASSWFQPYAAQFFQEMGVEAIHVTTANLQEPLQSFVPLSHARLGLQLMDDGRGMRIVTERGEAVDSDVQTALLYLCYLYSRPGATIGAPVSAPHILEAVAEGLGASIARTKEFARAVLEATKETNMHPLFDSLFAAGLVLLHLERTGLTLSDLLSLLPRFHLHRERIECPWDYKGQVMRRLMERTKNARAELVDGIRFVHDEGSVLLLPDADDPVFQVIVQADSLQAAESLVQPYREHILNALQ